MEHLLAFDNVQPMRIHDCIEIVYEIAQECETIAVYENSHM